MPRSDDLFSQLSLHWTDTDKVAIETGAGKLYRYRDIWAATSQFANALTASGVKPGDRVAAQVEKSPEALFLFLACLRAGAAYLPLNTAYTEAELEYFLRDAEPSVFVCRPGMSEAASLCERSGAPALFTLGTEDDGTLPALAGGQRDVFEDVPRSAGDLAALLYTSGTTGRSKGAMLTQGNFLSNAVRCDWAWAYGGRRAAARPAESSIPMASSWRPTPPWCRGPPCCSCRNSTWARYSRAATCRYDGGADLLCPPARRPRLNAGLVANIRLFISGSAPLLAETHGTGRAPATRSWNATA